MDKRVCFCYVLVVLAGIAQGKPELDSIKYSDYQRDF